MFFEPPAGRAEDREIPEPPAPRPWQSPPDTIRPGLVPAQRVLFRGDETVAILDVIRAYDSGCQIDIDIIARRTGSADEWDPFEIRRIVHGRIAGRSGRLTDDTVRFGVRFPDGSKATTLERVPHDDTTPGRPVLNDIFGGGGNRSGPDRLRIRTQLWLWPLPPPEPFDFVLEWPAGGIPETWAELDGAAIVAASAHAEPYWPEPELEPDPPARPEPEPGEKTATADG